MITFVFSTYYLYFSSYIYLSLPCSGHIVSNIFHSGSRLSPTSANIWSYRPRAFKGAMTLCLILFILSVCTCRYLENVYPEQTLPNDQGEGGWAKGQVMKRDLPAVMKKGHVCVVIILQSLLSKPSGAFLEIYKIFVHFVKWMKDLLTISLSGQLNVQIFILIHSEKKNFCCIFIET